MKSVDLIGIFTFFIIIGVLIGLSVWGIWEYGHDDTIKVHEPLTPEIQLIVKDNVVDTLYIYRNPN